MVSNSDIDDDSAMENGEMHQSSILIDNYSMNNKKGL